MRRTLSVLSGLLLLALCPPVARATFVNLYVPPVPERVSTSDVVLVGRVARIEKATVSARSQAPGTQESFQVVVVKAETGILGAKKGEDVRLGVLKALPTGIVLPGRRPAGPAPVVALRRGQQVLVFASKHPKENFYTIRTTHMVVDRATPSFAKDLTLAKKCADFLANPIKGLTSRDKGDHMLAAGLLIYRYRWAGKGDRTEPIDAKESRLILRALAEADWNFQAVSKYWVAPARLFTMLGVTEKDGWTRPQDVTKYADAARKWVKDHAGSYRVERFVSDKSEAASQN